MQPEEKVWGQTTELFRNGTTSTHYLEIKKGGYCSEHRHAQKSNIFYLIAGRLKLTLWGLDKPGCTIVILDDVRQFEIPLGTWHKFSAITDVKCIEIYDYKYDGVDIERRSEGGIH